jgi:hypothetical protein
MGFLFEWSLDPFVVFGARVRTNVVMFVLAIALSLFTVVRRAVEQEGSAAALVERQLVHRAPLVSQSGVPRA